MDQLVNQKELFISKLNVSLNGGDFKVYLGNVEEFLGMLHFVSDFWISENYGYKLGEMCTRMLTDLESLRPEKLHHLTQKVYDERRALIHQSISLYNARHNKAFYGN